MSSFFQSLAGNRRLEELFYHYIRSRWTLPLFEVEFDQLFKAVCQLKSLKKLVLTKYHHRLWNQLMVALQDHPSLEVVDIDPCEHCELRPYYREISNDQKIDATVSLGRMLRNNRKIQKVEFRSFDRAIWDSQVAPALELNRLYPDMQRFKAESESFRRASVKQSLITYARRPWLTWALLSDHREVIAQFPPQQEEDQQQQEEDHLPVAVEIEQ